MRIGCLLERFAHHRSCEVLAWRDRTFLYDWLLNRQSETVCRAVAQHRVDVLPVSLSFLNVIRKSPSYMRVFDYISRNPKGSELERGHC